MRLWSIHPSYLDAKGLVALWREGLLARKVLKGETLGYTQHPQLMRFKASKDPLKAIDAYLECVVQEADARGYTFDHSKISSGMKVALIPVTNGQIAYETEHLRSKLQVRDPERMKNVPRENIRTNPIFILKEGPVEEWEKVS